MVAPLIVWGGIALLGAAGFAGVSAGGYAAGRAVGEGVGDGLKFAIPVAAGATAIYLFMKKK